MSWYLDRLTTRTLPVTTPYSPEYTGLGVNVFVVTHRLPRVIKKVIYSVSPAANIDVKQIPKNISDEELIEVLSNLFTVIKPQQKNVLLVDVCKPTNTTLEKFNGRFSDLSALKICPAGDECKDSAEFWPAQNKHLFSIGAHDEYDFVSFEGDIWSNWGNVDFYAPGIRVDIAPNFYQSGTWVAAAIATGVVAQYCEKYPQADYDFVKKIILANCNTNTLCGVWYPYLEELKAAHFKHQNKRQLTAPTEIAETFWLSNTNLGTVFFGKPPVTVTLEVLPDVTAIISSDYAQIPSFVTLKDKTLTINTRQKKVPEGIHKFVLVAKNEKGKEQHETFSVVVTHLGKRTVETEFSYVYIDGEYREVGNLSNPDADQA